MQEIKKFIKIIKFSFIPIVLLIIIGLWSMAITDHQKIFKTYLIFWFDILLTAGLIIHFLRDKKNKINPEYLLYFFIYFLYIFSQFIVSFISGEITYDKEYYLANYILLILFSTFIFLYIQNTKQIKIGLFIICIFFFIILIKSLIALRNHNLEGLPFANFRPALSFGNTNYMAGFLIGLLPLAIITPLIWLKSKKNDIKIIITTFFLTLIIGIICFIPIYFTKTRAAIAAIIFSTIFIFIPSLLFIKIKLSWKIKLPIILGIILICALFLFFLIKFPPSFMKNIFARIYKTLDSLNFFLKDRTENAWAGGITLFKKHPVFGAGLGSIYPASFQYTPKFFNIYSRTMSFKHSHGEYIEILGEAGIFGFILFLLLVGFIVINLFIRIFNTKYKKDYRIICLGVNTGIISMLLHQILSLTLRMSVTMSVYFFLIGLGIFLISYSKNALVNSKTKNNNNEIKSIYLFNKIHINIKIIKLIIIFTFIISILASGFLFFPVFNSEYHLREYKKSRIKRNIYHKKYYEAMNTKDYEKAENYIHYFKRYHKKMKYHINKSLDYKKDHIYTLGNKYEFDIENLYIEKYGNPDDDFFSIIRQDLDNINSIIPNYMENNLKYFYHYLQEYEYYNNKYIDSNNLDDIEKSKKSFNLAYKYLNKALDKNFLLPEEYIYKLIFMRNNNKDINEEKYIEVLQDYTISRIYLDFAKKNKIIKENIIINFTNKNDFIKNDNKFIFYININDIININKTTLTYNKLSNFEKLQNTIYNNINHLLKNLYSKAGL